MADNTSCEDNNENDYKLEVDLSQAIKELKVIQREAKKATHALKELEEQHNEIIDLPVRAEGSS